jgi:phosphoribosyl 1,2-cyclic phosphodiesterase
MSDSGGLKITFRGVRGSIASPGLHTARYGGNTSCLELRCANAMLILDAGTGIRSLGLDLVAEFGATPIEATILISHTHWDHIQGLPFFLPAFFSQHRIRLMAPHGRGSRLRHALSNQMDPISFPVGLEQMRGLSRVQELDSAAVSLGPFAIRVTDLNHPGGCAGFRIETEGVSIAYLPDHEPFGNDSAPGGIKLSNARNRALVEFVAGVDLLILDTQYTEAEYRDRRGWGHGCLPDSVFFAVEAGVRQLALFHHDPAHDDRDMDAIVETARELSRPQGLAVMAARENETVMLGRAKTPLIIPTFPGLTSSFTPVSTLR